MQMRQKYDLIDFESRKRMGSLSPPYTSLSASPKKVFLIVYIHSWRRWGKIFWRGKKVVENEILEFDPISLQVILPKEKNKIRIEKSSILDVDRKGNFGRLYHNCHINNNNNNSSNDNLHSWSFFVPNARYVSCLI